MSSYLIKHKTFKALSCYIFGYPMYTLNRVATKPISGIKNASHPEKCKDCRFQQECKNHPQVKMT